MNKMTRETVRRFLRGIIVMIVMLGGVRGSKGVDSGEEKISIISDGFKVILGGIAVYVANSVRDITFIKIDEEREGDKEEEKKTKLEVEQCFNTHFAGDFSRKWEYLKENFVKNNNEDTFSVAGSIVLNSKRTTISDLSNAKEPSIAGEDVEDDNIEDSDVEDNDVEILSNVDIDNLPEENEVQKDIKERLKALTIVLPALKKNVNVDIDVKQGEDAQKLLETLNHSFVGKKINKEKMLVLKTEMVQKEIEEEVKKRQKIEDTIEFYKAPSFIKDRDKALERAENLRQARKDLKEKIEKINDLIEYFDDLQGELKEIQEKKNATINNQGQNYSQMEVQGNYRKDLMGGVCSIKGLAEALRVNVNSLIYGIIKEEEVLELLKKDDKNLINKGKEIMELQGGLSQEKENMPSKYLTLDDLILLEENKINKDKFEKKFNEILLKDDKQVMSDIRQKMEDSKYRLEFLKQQPVTMSEQDYKRDREQVKIIEAEVQNYKNIIKEKEDEIERYEQNLKENVEGVKNRMLLSMTDKLKTLGFLMVEKTIIEKKEERNERRRMEDNELEKKQDREIRMELREERNKKLSLDKVRKRKNKRIKRRRAERNRINKKRKEEDKQDDKRRYSIVSEKLWDVNKAGFVGMVKTWHESLEKNKGKIENFMKKEDFHTMELEAFMEGLFILDRNSITTIEHAIKILEDDKRAIENKVENRTSRNLIMENLYNKHISLNKMNMQFRVFDVISVKSSLLELYKSLKTSVQISFVRNCYTNNVKIFLKNLDKIEILLEKEQLDLDKKTFRFLRYSVKTIKKILSIFFIEKRPYVISKFDFIKNVKGDKNIASCEELELFRYLLLYNKGLIKIEDDYFNIENSKGISCLKDVRKNHKSDIKSLVSSCGIGFFKEFDKLNYPYRYDYKSWEEESFYYKERGYSSSGFNGYVLYVEYDKFLDCLNEKLKTSYFKNNMMEKYSFGVLESNLEKTLLNFFSKREHYEMLLMDKFSSCIKTRFDLKIVFNQFINLIMDKIEVIQIIKDTVLRREKNRGLDFNTESYIYNINLEKYKIIDDLNLIYKIERKASVYNPSKFFYKKYKVTDVDCVLKEFLRNNRSMAREFNAGKLIVVTANKLYIERAFDLNLLKSEEKEYVLQFFHDDFTRRNNFLKNKERNVFSNNKSIFDYKNEDRDRIIDNNKKRRKSYNIEIYKIDRDWKKNKISTKEYYSREKKLYRSLSIDALKDLGFEEHITRQVNSVNSVNLHKGNFIEYYNLYKDGKLSVNQEADFRRQARYEFDIPVSMSRDVNKENILDNTLRKIINQERTDLRKDNYKRIEEGFYSGEYSLEEMRVLSKKAKEKFNKIWSLDKYEQINQKNDTI